MTREEAIKVLERYEPIECGDDQDAFDMAKEALTHECDSCIYNVCNYNSVPWESNGELIDRQAAVNELKGQLVETWAEWEAAYHAGVEYAIGVIEALPSAEPVHGEWKCMGDCRYER